MKVCIVQPALNVVSETFIRAHRDLLPAEVSSIHGINEMFPLLDNESVLGHDIARRGIRKVKRLLEGREWSWEITTAYINALKKSRADVVLAEYGPSAVKVLDACRELQLPLVVHFHGYDATEYKVLEKHRQTYQEVFDYAAGIVAVSNPMRDQLISLGALASKVHVNPCGVDCRDFMESRSERARPTFLAVGRFVDKKAPHLTLLSFAEMVQSAPDSRLVMIGDGPLLGACKSLAEAKGLVSSVSFLGSQPHEVVRKEMRCSRAMVQHSIQADNGDCEGTPVAVLEAGASALPVVATYHAGIPDVVVDGETGFLVEEKDVPAMAERMLRLANNRELAETMGKAARRRISTFFTMEQSIDRLWKVIEAAAIGKMIEPLQLSRQQDDAVVSV